MPAQNRSAHGKNVTQKPGKSKATESSQGRAQSWWRPSRAWEAWVECQWQGKVARKCKSLQWGKQHQSTSKEIPGSSYKQSTIAGSFVKSPKDIKRKEKIAKVSIKKMTTEVLLILPLYLILFVIWWRFRHLINLMADVENILNEDDFFFEILLIHKKKALSSIENENA